ncbi:MAG: CHAT domain-containing protein [Pyrinomonadaceae bacterium]|nr:CHAT domain-containing protein [Pyrinomonadaceae bacterium]
MKKLISLILCILSLSQINGYAQTVPAAGTAQVTPEGREFEGAVERYRIEFSKLAARRGGVPEDDALVFQFRKKLLPLSTSDLAKVVRENYPQDTSILFYDYEAGSLRAWVIDQQGIKGYAQSEASSTQIKKTIINLRQALGIEKLQRARAPQNRVLEQEEDDPPPAAAQQAVNIAQAIKSLTALLLPPNIAKALASTRHVIVVPVLEIGLVPFAVLQPFGAEEFLIDRMSISFAPSLFDVTAEKPEPWSAKFNHPLIVGNPQFTDKSKWKIPALPGAEEEAIAVANLLQTKPLIGKAATKQMVLTQIGDADLLYFATHGVGDTKNSRNKSFLVFGFTESDLGFWSMEEILNSHQKWGVISGNKIRSPLKARLAVLSACQTGIGEAWKGGVLSLGRTMQASGVPRVVMSLWNVSDNATVDLMKSFVTHLEKDIPAEALRKAMLKTRCEHPSPAHWAAFVYFGLPY